MQFTFRFLTPLMFAFAVMMYFGGFRMVAFAFSAAGCVGYLISQELSSKGR
jgi:hypothetical protein